MKKEDNNIVQEKRDANYPREYVFNVDLKIQQWEKLIQDRNIFTLKDIELIKEIYLFDNHAATCTQLAKQDDKHTSSYNSIVANLGKRVSNKMNLKHILKDDGKIWWWCVTLWGRYDKYNHFEWKLRPELAKAISNIYPELELLENEEKEESKLINELRKNKINSKEFKYYGKARKRKLPTYLNGKKTYVRDRKISTNALAHANYVCEIDCNHPTFLRKNSDVNYTEPHHLVPMSYSDAFEVSLDVEENIVSLCSNCHNQIHYGKGAIELIEKLFEDRKNELKKVGINISLEKLLEMY